MAATVRLLVTAKADFEGAGAGALSKTAEDDEEEEVFFEAGGAELCLVSEDVDGEVDSSDATRFLEGLTAATIWAT